MFFYKTFKDNHSFVQDEFIEIDDPTSALNALIPVQQNDNDDVQHFNIGIYPSRRKSTRSELKKYFPLRKTEAFYFFVLF